MAKRFTDTEKYKKPFLRSLPGAYKLFWDYLYHDCDHAGIWIVDFEIAQIYIGTDMPVNKDEALEHFNNDEERIIEVDCGKKWFIPSFIEFQYGELNESNRAHSSVLRILNKNGLLDNKGLISPLQGAKDKEQDKDKVKVKVKGSTEGKKKDQGKNKIPSLDDFLQYAKEREPEEFEAKKHNIELKYQSWIVAGWKNGNGKEIKNWKSALLNTLPHIKAKNINSMDPEDIGSTKPYEDVKENFTY